MKFDIYSASCKFISIEKKRSLEINLSKKAIFTVKKELGLFFLALSSVTNLQKAFLGTLRLSDSYCGIYKIISSGPKRSIETTFQKYGNLPDENKNWPISSPNTQHGNDRLQAAIF